MDIKRTVKAAAKELGIKGKLKKTQANAINDILNQHDVLVIAPTGFGKTAIFQIPALQKKGITLVIVPTLSLIHDQVDKLQQLGISVGYVCSESMSWGESDIRQALSQYGYVLVYTTPESLFRLELTALPANMVVVDECHCVTTWGYSFREAYLNIGVWIRSLQVRPVVVAMTATAPMVDRKQIVKLLSMERVKYHTVSLYRPKLTFTSCTFVSEEARQRKLKNLLKKRLESDGACIIYCNTKKSAKAVFDMVKVWYPQKAVICHAKLPGGERKHNERSFMSGKRKIMVATSAFGMGVDKADVRLVIHYNLPLSLVDYYQQAGRAGRDGGKAKCVLFYMKSDYDRNRYIIEQNQQPKALQYALAALNEIKEYADGNGCMVQRMLSALGEELKTPCGRCTNCQKERKLK